MLPFTEWSRVGIGYFTMKTERSKNWKIERLYYRENIKLQLLTRLYIYYYAKETLLNNMSMLFRLRSFVANPKWTCYFGVRPEISF